MWADCVARALVTPGQQKMLYRLHMDTGYSLVVLACIMEVKLGAAVIPISGGNTARQIQTIMDFGSTVLACTPSYCIHS